VLLTAKVAAAGALRFATLGQISVKMRQLPKAIRMVLPHN